jgi:hypothetical protein
MAHPPGSHQAHAPVHRTLWVMIRRTAASFEERPIRMTLQA